MCVCMPRVIVLFLNVPSTIFQLYKDGSSWVDQYLARINVLAQGHNGVKPVRLEPAAPRSRGKHSTTEPLHSHMPWVRLCCCTSLSETLLVTIQ